VPGKRYLLPNGDTDLTRHEGPLSARRDLWRYLTGAAGDTSSGLLSWDLVKKFDVVAGTLPGQIGGITTYTTATSTTGYKRTVELGGTGDKWTALSILPPGLDNRVPTPHIVFLHGAQADEDNGIFGGGFTAHTGPMAMVDDWLDRGWGVISLREGSAAGGGASSDLWANNACRMAMVDVLNAYVALFRQHDHGMPVYGESMGGMMAVNLAVQAKLTGAFNLSSLVLIDPAINAQYVYSIYGPHPAFHPLGDAFAAAYGLTALASSAAALAWVPDATWATKVETGNGAGSGPGHDPMTVGVSDIIATPYHGRMPMYVLHSSSDAVVDEGPNGQSFATHLRANGWTATDLTEVSTNRGHLDPAHFIPSTQTGFMLTWLAA
jgi:hypothetical protein